MILLLNLEAHSMPPTAAAVERVDLSVLLDTHAPAQAVFTVPTGAVFFLTKHLIKSAGHTTCLRVTTPTPLRDAADPESALLFRGTHTQAKAALIALVDLLISPANGIVFFTFKEGAKGAADKLYCCAAPSLLTLGSMPAADYAIGRDVDRTRGTTP